MKRSFWTVLLVLFGCAAFGAEQTGERFEALLNDPMVLLARGGAPASFFVSPQGDEQTVRGRLLPPPGIGFASIARRKRSTVSRPLLSWPAGTIRSRNRFSLRPPTRGPKKRRSFGAAPPVRGFTFPVESLCPQGKRSPMSGFSENSSPRSAITWWKSTCPPPMRSIFGSPMGARRNCSSAGRR